MKTASKRPHRLAFLRKCWQLLIAVLAFSSAAAQSDQNRYAPINGYGFKYKRHASDSIQLIPLYASPHVPYRAGALKYRESDSSIYKWTGTQWLKEGSGSSGDSSLWELDGSNNLVNKSFPGAKIEINKRLSGLDSGYIFTSTLSGTNPGEGTGYKTFWHPGKAAFRSGYTDASSFNNAFIGQYSTSFGYNATASGIASFSAGIGTLASGQGSIALGGSGTQATGNNSIAGGLGSVASGTNSMAFGNSSNAAGQNSFAAGFNPASNGSASTAFNSATRANGEHSAAFGEGSDANAKWGFAAGQFSQTNYSLVIPQFVIGRFSDTTIGSELFRIGWGSHVGGPKRNVYTVDTLGHMRIASPATGSGTDSVLVRVTGTGEVRMVSQADLTGSGGATNTELDLTMIVDTATGGGIDTLGNAYYRYSVTNDKKVEHAVQYASLANGNNSYNGETEDSAKLTIAAVAIELNNRVYSKGRAYGVLQSNNLWREQFDASMPNIGLGAYGLFSASYKLPPIISGADVHNSGWTVAAGARYTKDITLSIGSNFGYDYPYIVEIDTVLEKTDYWGARRQLQWVASTALVESTPGSFHNANLTNPVTLHIHTSDGAAPGSNGFRYEVSTKRNCISASTSLPGLSIQNLAFLTPGGGYGHIGAATGGGAQMPTIMGNIFFGVGTHAIVSQGGSVHDNVFMQGIRGLNAGSIAGAFYKDNGTGMYGDLNKNIFLDMISAWTTHESGSISSKFERVRYRNNYWYSDTTFAGTAFGSEFVRRLDITGNYVFGASSFVTSAADTLNIIGNVIRNITNKSLTATSTSVFSNWMENLFEFTPPNIGSTRSAIESVQTGDSFVVKRNIIHMKGVLNIDESQQVLGRTSTAAAPTKTDFSYNIIIGEAPATRYTKVYIVDQNGVEDAAPGMKADYNVYILVSGNGFMWVRSTPFGGGSPSMFTLSSVQTNTSLEQNSIFIDLTANPDGLRDIFVDPDNGNWTLTTSANADLIRAVGAGMSNPPTFYPSRPSYTQAAETVLRGDNTSPYASWQYGGTYGGAGGGEANTGSNVGTGAGVFKQKTGVDLEFKSLTEPASVDVVSNTNDLAIQLVNDNATPGNNKVYGTNGSGVKGWKDDPAGGGSTDTTRFWHVSGNTLVNPRLFGANDIATIKFIMNGDFAGALRSTKQWLFANDSTGITNTMARVAIKNTAELAGISITGATSGLQPDIAINTTHTATANNQSTLGLQITGSTVTGGFTGISATPISVSHSLPSGTIVGTIDNPGASGTAEWRVSGSNGAIRLTSAGRAWATVGNLSVTPASANFQIMFEKSFAVTGMNHDSVGLRIGDATRPSARLDIIANQHWRAQIRLVTGGTFLATPLAGAIETQGDDIAYTIATATSRKRFVLEDATIAAGQIFYGGTNGRAVGNSTFLFDATNFMLRYGTTSSNPGLQANGENLRARLADNSASTDIEVADEAYDATNWNGSLEVPTKNAVRDHIVSLNLTASTYTPTFTLGTNVDGVTAPGTTLYYQRIGNQVTVWGNVSVDATAASTTTNFEIDLPVASAMTGLYHLSGQLNSWSAGGGQGGAEANVTNDRANFSFQNGTATGAVTYTIRFTYEVL